VRIMTNVEGHLSCGRLRKKISPVTIKAAFHELTECCALQLNKYSVLREATVPGHYLHNGEAISACHHVD
jgi:hypothetical protein